MNWKDIEFQASRNIKNFSSQVDVILCGLYQYHIFIVAQVPFKIRIPSLSLSYLSCQNRSIRFDKPNCPVSDTGYVWPFSPDYSKIFQTYPVILPDLSGLLSKFSVFFKIFIFGLSLPSILIYVIM
jgi:hypothetical protein